MARPLRPRSVLAVVLVAALAAGGLWTLSAVALSSPSLPPVTPEQVVASTARAMASRPSVSGRMDVHVDLGLPSIAADALTQQLGGAASVLGDHRLRVWRSADGLRISDLLPLGERSLFVSRLEGEAWAWDWSSFTAVRIGPIPDDDGAPPPFELVDPLELARRSLDALDATTQISVDGTARVAGRSAYVLVLRPRTTQTLVGRIEIAVDADRWIPLRAAVYPRGETTAALSATFDSVSFDPVDPSVYLFVPPTGAKVEQLRDLIRGIAGSHATSPDLSGDDGGPESAAVDDVDEYVRTFGRGWATVVALRVPAPSAQPSDGFDPLSMLPFSGNLFSVRLVEHGDRAWLVYGAVPPAALAAVEARLPLSAIVTRGLSKRYADLAAVDSLDLSIEPGTLFGFLGPNGAGKTTTIRMLLGLIFPTEGSIEILGLPVFGGAHGRSALRRVGAIVEEPAFWGYLSGRKNLECFARLAGPPDDRAARLARIDDVLHTVGLSEAASKKVKRYSQGMRQRLGIALALLGAPELLVLDEPTNGLDPGGMREVRLLLRRLASEGVTVFVSSHLLSEVEAMCDRVGVLARGRLVADGPPSNLRPAGDRLRLEVGDRERALSVLAGIAGVAVEPEDSQPGSTGDGRIRVRLSVPATAAAVNAALVSGGVEVSALIPEHERLEDVFVSLVEGADVPR